jgi:hypothetical protein
VTVAPGVDIWWTRGSEMVATSDAQIHCRAGSIVAGIPPSWRSGGRRQLLDTALAKYAKKGSAVTLPSGHQFSLSDSGYHLAVGVGRHVPLGIDIERQRPVDDALATLRRLGLSALATRLGELAPAARNRAFLTVWTAFEAFLKLERLKWETGAERFAAMAPYWVVGTSGSVEFRGSDRTGVFFTHAEVPGEINITAATPKPVAVEIRRVNVALRARIATL